ncbi:MAG: glycoside hydrolase family 43 protein [Calditrichaeota bacterium]|nr:glycoside hydrolase family 43 protein [Calditrichota bacterium]
MTIGSRLELFVDDFLIDHLSGRAELCLHHPTPREIVLVHDAPWEGTGSGYHSIFKDGDIYRMYYKAWQIFATDKRNTHPLFCCYAESDDGIHWRKPKLGLYEFQGSKANNIVMTSHKIGNVTVNAGHPAVFKDTNPNASPDARYKAFFRASTTSGPGLLPFKSPDGIHWTPMCDTLVITDGAFDSQNLAFWDSVHGEYRAYWRYFSKESPDARYEGVRAIRTATSKDFLHWSKPINLRYVDSPQEHLYTNQIKPYYRAPYLLIGFPTRYINRGWSASMRALPELKQREWRAEKSERYGTALTEALFMVSRDGVLFKRWNEAFLRPGIERPGTWNYGQQYIAWQLVETKSAMEGAPNELSLYATESYWTDPGSALRRYTLRIDGFVSVHAPMSGGELLTRPLIFTGSKLVLNFSSSAAGDIRVEIQDESGNPLPGFALADCPPIFGDAIARPVTWENGRDLSSLQGRPVRLRFILRDADLYSLRFQ